MRVIGVDPGSRVTGYGIVDLTGSQLRHVQHGNIRLVKYETFTERLEALYAELSTVIDEHRPECAAIEEVFQARNARSALKLGHARGVLMLACRHRGLDVSEYAPNRIKQAVTGYGHADKEQVKRMVSTLLSLSTMPPSDAADALATAICHLFSTAHLRKVTMR